MMETKQERAERKSIFIARATSHFDSPKIRRQASRKWERANRDTIKSFWEFPARFLEFVVEIPGAIIKLWKTLLK